MSDNKMFSGDIDPEIAELMGIEATSVSSEPEFNELFSDDAPKQQPKEEVNLTRNKFEHIVKIEENAKPFFADKNYYKNLLNDGSEAGKRLHTLLTSFMSTQDPKDRSIFRGKMIAAYWNFIERIAREAHTNLPVPKLLVLRFGLLHPGILSQEQRTMISKVIMPNTSGEPVHYVDEWLKKVITGQANPSATDETKAIKVHVNKKVHSQLENIRGQQTFHSGNIHTKVSEMETLEAAIKSKIDFISNHVVRPELGNLKTGYTDQQKQAVMDIQNMVRDLLTLDRDVTRATGELEQIKQQIDELEGKAESLEGVAAVDTRVISTEFNTVRQMHKMCVGRQGNHVPILMKNYFRPHLNETGIREVVINELASIEALDPGLFLRTFKQQTNRIVPHIILVPCYGDRGICWEPFERYNKASSRGRVAIPIFSKDIRSAIIMACGDLRWQVAKEKAQHYWMEEGLTGRYYQWFTSRKLRGDVKEYFIQDYLLWITKESEGTQKLEREARAILWRFTPFPQELRDLLRNRGFVYSDLYKRDLNRAASDGY